MQTKSDAQLHREYATHRSESAFSEIVARHTNLVYCAAARQMPSSDLARDVTQRVFTALAQTAGSLSNKMAEDASVAGWLYRTTRNLVLNFRRDEYRRHQRERQAMEHLYTGTEASPDWNCLSPLLDEAMGELTEADHDALLLRYFKNEDLRTVGRALGVSDDAAQKRVSRAIDRLREFFSKHGITVATGSLAAAISTNAATAAPVGLAASISAAAVLTAHTAGSVAVANTTLTTLNLINMKSLAVIGAAALAVGTSTYLVEHSKVNRLLAENQALSANHDQLLAEREAAKLSANRNDGELARLRDDQNELLRLRNEVGVLRHQTNEIAKLRKQNQQLNDQFNAFVEAQRQAEIAQASPERQAMMAKMNDAKALCLGLLLYAEAHQEQFPRDLNDITNYLAGANATLTGTNQFELVVYGPLTPANISKPSETIAVREKEASSVQGNWVKTYGFVDGHSEIKKEPPEGFDAWEQAHMLPPPAAR